MSNKLFLLRLKQLIFLLLISLFVQAGVAAPFNTHILDSGVVRIEIRLANGGKITGSGMLVNREGYVLTNYHVIHKILKTKNAHFFIYDGNLRKPERKKFKIVWYAHRHDIALLKVENINQKRHPVIFADSENDNTTKGMRVWTLGFPAASDTAGAISLEPILKDGVISIKRDMTLVTSTISTHMYEHSAVINGGNSGGPLLNNCGFVIGMNQSKASSTLIAQGTFWSIRSIELIKALSRLNIKFYFTRATCRASTVIDSSESHQAFLKQLNNSYNRWQIMTLLLAGLFIIFITSLFWWKYKTHTSHEGVSKYVRHELSRILKHRENREDTALVQERTVSGERMTVISHNQDTVFGILVGHGIVQGQQCFIREAPILIGRGREVDFRIKDERVGRRHVKLGWDQAQRKFYIEDLGSVNGTWLTSDQKINSGHRYYLTIGMKFCVADVDIILSVSLPDSGVLTT
ncbi:hypothetical protein MNBD_GAMMA12-151 [hydrothermal vent metagenome]|uniref:FHA domain-containing protein n=1 Tax=hydrothermal vent metagenome TaxID=652676 RepID=A0A3B0Y153_9ZZZZ